MSIMDIHTQCIALTCSLLRRWSAKIVEIVMSVFPNPISSARMAPFVLVGILLAFVVESSRDEEEEEEAGGDVLMIPTVRQFHKKTIPEI